MVKNPPAMAGDGAVGRPREGPVVGVLETGLDRGRGRGEEVVRGLPLLSATSETGSQAYLLSAAAARASLVTGIPGIL